MQLKPLDLVATTVHELKTPLTLISGLSTMLEQGQFGKLNDQQTRYIAKISDVSQRLLVLVESLLIVNKSHHQRLRLSLQPVSIPVVIQNVLDELEPRLQQCQIVIKWRHSRSIEPVLADRDSLYQIIYNLVDNAIKYSPAKTTITIKFRHQEGWLYLRVSDQGIGVKPNELKYLFRRFGKVGQPVGAHASSTGLGLYIVKKLAESQGGKVRAQTLRRGTCFIVQLPVARQLLLFNPTPRGGMRHSTVAKSKVANKKP